MSVANFIPSVWNETLERDLERLCVFAEDCNRKYEGQITEKGDSIKILGVGKPTIHKVGKDRRNDDIPSAEKIEDTAIFMPIEQMAVYNYKVGDIDKAQAVEGLMSAYQEETAEGLANDIDTYIASKVVDDGVTKVNGEAGVIVTKENVLSILDKAKQMLKERDVKASTKIVATVSPAFVTLLKQAYTDLDTDNSEMLKNGVVGRYNGIIIKESNNVHKTDDGTMDNIMIRTQRAIAYAKPFDHSEAYRPENSFADAVKGYILYDAKVVRPKEILNINVKYA